MNEWAMEVRIRSSQKRIERLTMLQRGVDIALESLVLLKNRGHSSPGEFGSSLATMAVKNCKAGV